MADSLPASLSDIVDETYDDSDDVETMTAAQVLAKLEEVSTISFRLSAIVSSALIHHRHHQRISGSRPSGLYFRLTFNYNINPSHTKTHPSVS